MDKFMKGLALCEGFFQDCARGIIEKHFPGLRYSAGLIGYGSDVLGYDDPVSTDHMWGPRFYMFLDEEDIGKKEAVFRILGEELPYTYKGYSVNFTEPAPHDGGVQHPEFITSGKVNPLVFIQTFDSFLLEQLGTANLKNIAPFEWLAFSEHRLLSLVRGRFFADRLGCAAALEKIRYYPKDVKLYLTASNWNIIASEQAFVRRCGDCGDGIGSRIVCARICERLMRLCFLYRDTYAPYSKWFGTAFDKLDVPAEIKRAIGGALAADSLEVREDCLVKAQALAAELHNGSGLTERVDFRVERYFGRDIKVIFADKFSDAARDELKGSAFENVPLMGSLSQIGGLECIADDKAYRERVMGLYGKINS